MRDFSRNTFQFSFWVALAIGVLLVAGCKQEPVIVSNVELSPSLNPFRFDEGTYWVYSLEGDTLISLTWVPTRLTQSVIPIGAVLFVIGQLLSFPEMWRQATSEKGIAAHDDVELPGDDSENSAGEAKP